MNLAICCASSKNIPDVYFESAERLFEKLFKEENNLVFGAMNSGIMGLAYKKAKEHNRKVLGIVQKIYAFDLDEMNCDEEILTDCVNDRTNLLVEHSDCMIVLPGGLATLYELFSFLEMKRSHEYDKPLILYNETGFFDPILDFVNNKIYQEKFTGKEAIRKNIKIATKPEDILNILKSLK